MEERENRISEKPATHKKKGQIWLFGGIGFIALLLLVNMIYQMFSNDDSSKDVALPKTVRTESADNDPSRFDALLNSRNRNVNGEKQEPKKSPYDKTLKPEPSAQGGRTGAGGMLSGQKDSKRDLIKDVEDRFKAQELERSLKARQTHYADSGNAIPSAASSYKGSPGVKGGSNAQRISAIGEQRGALETRIKMIEAQGNQLPDRSAALQAGLAAQRARAGSGNTSGGNTSGGDFGGHDPSGAPANIVGYSADNEYNASLEGKVKAPAGTVINAISTFTAISDYAGGSMKGMISSDVLDATNSYVLIPKGSELMIKAVAASGVNQVLQHRMAFTVQWCVLPNGNKIDFRKASVLDRMGTPAVEGDEVDYHIMAQILGVTAYALVGTTTSYEGSGDGDQSFAGNAGSAARNQASGLAQKYLQVVPTVTIHAGQPLRIILEDEMYIKPWKTLYENYVD
ncbi:TrbI/VirB10 family protein [Scandinavium goeteborgense]|uniref:Type IV secretion system protein VirB10 n=1 Tax=Scandinavium goeteborgense TaxID=1851514 RepID=A0A4R6DUU0_SCAGO|nr:TrbI/VirB10 family protein [Scandinavium goeteborgense]TDN48068.1 type IV secretion system protein VirB10 [Scandinavium goeteborgense]